MKLPTWIVGIGSATRSKALEDRRVRFDHPAIKHSYKTNRFERKAADNQDYPLEDTDFWIVRVWVESSDFRIREVRLKNNEPRLYWIRNEPSKGAPDITVTRIRASGGAHVTLNNQLRGSSIEFGIATENLAQQELIKVTTEKCGVSGTDTLSDVWIGDGAEPWEKEYQMFFVDSDN